MEEQTRVTLHIEGKSGHAVQMKNICLQSSAKRNAEETSCLSPQTQPDKSSRRDAVTNTGSGVTRTWVPVRLSTNEED